MTAWEAITVAAVANTTIGMRAHSGVSRKNGAAEVASSSESTSAPCPK